MGNIWKSDRARNAAVIIGVIILFVLSIVVVFMSSEEMKKITIEDCKNDLSQELVEAGESIDEYLELKIRQVTAVRDLYERIYSEKGNAVDEKTFTDLLQMFIADSTYIDVLVQYRDGDIYNINGGKCINDVSKHIENMDKEISGAFSYTVNSVEEQAYAVVVPFENNEKMLSLIAINACSDLSDVIRHYDTLKSHIQLFDHNNVLMSEIYDCDIKEEHELVEEISVFSYSNVADWQIKARVDKKVVASVTERYSSVIFSQMLIVITSFILYFIVIISAAVSYEREKKQIFNERQKYISESEKNIDDLKSIVDAIGKKYLAMYSLNLSNLSFVEIVSEGEVKELFDEDNSLEDKLEQMCDTYVAPEYRDEFTEFLDISTLHSRLVKHSEISLEYQVDNGMWNKASIIIQKTKDGIVEEVLFIIQETDVEKRRETEYKQNLFAAVEEANRANNSKSKFLSKMSHDIRTPINGIIGMVDIAKKNWENKEKVGECFEKMNNASKYLLSIVDDVLNMSKFEKGDIELEEDVVNLNELIDECIEDILPMANEAEITVKKQKISITNSKVIASLPHLQQVFHNILNNAVKYTEKGGVVGFAVEQLSFDGKLASYKFIISDTGIGMSDEFIEVLYEPFSQEYENARTTYQGVGLGLSIVKGIVDKMGGRIDVKSKEGIGTTFAVTLTMSVVEGGEECDNNNEKTEKDLKDKTILVIEDNMLNMEIAVFMLEEAGVNVLTAENGKEGVEVFEHSKQGEIDLILMDVMMPVVDGIEATKIIRAMSRKDAETIPILAMTANAFAEDVLAVKNVGMNDHIPKPIVMEKFYEKITYWI